jgi:UDP-N-acetylmuramate--alanine ligase
MKIYCAGIGGIGLSAYACHMHARGHTVLGSDRSFSVLTETLVARGIHCTNQQDGSHLPVDTDLFVFSEAIPFSSPERTKAREHGIRSLSYFQALGELTREGTTLCIAGTHGKSSTTAMLAKICIDAGRDPNVILGTKAVDMDGSNWRKGQSDLWIVESCEYQKQFLALSPSSLIITNADGDHFDAFRDQQDYEDAFHAFAQKVPASGAVVIHEEDGILARIVQGLPARILRVPADDVPSTQALGKHMRQNAALARALARDLGIDDETIHVSLATFRGTWRRMEVRGSLDCNALLIDDYAHHPVEITATLTALKEAYPTRRIVCAFQPHTHDRTLQLWKGFVESLSLADVLILAPVYDARPDREREEANLEALQKDIALFSGKEPLLCPSLSSVAPLLRDILTQDDLVITMGAGTITEVADVLMSSEVKTI